MVRRHFKLSAEAMGAVAGITGTGIADIEKGKTLNPRSEVLANISAKLGVAPDWLLLGDGEMLKPVDANELARELRLGIDASKAGMETVRGADGRLALSGRTQSEAVADEKLSDSPSTTLSNPTPTYKEFLAKAEKELGKHPGAYCSRKAAIRAMELLHEHLQASAEPIILEQLITTPAQCKQIVALVIDDLMLNQEFLTEVAQKVKAL